MRGRKPGVVSRRSVTVRSAEPQRTARMDRSEGEKPGRGEERGTKQKGQGQTMRVMAIDYGDARTGVAISDVTGMLAGSATVIHSRDDQRVLDELVRLIQSHRVDELVMGFPRNMDGTEGPRAELYRAFAARLEERSGMPVHLWDERRTTIEAHQILHASGKRMQSHKKTVDAVAATLILEGYLARKRLGRS